MSKPNAILWFRRDLRTADHPAFEAAIKYASANSARVLPVFVIDPFLIERSGANRVAFLFRSLRSLMEAGLPISIHHGRPEDVIVSLARDIEAEVFVSGDAAPYGSHRDTSIETELASFGSQLHRIETNYIVPPGTVRKGDQTPFKVFTPFSRVWLTHAVGHSPGPRIKLSAVPWLDPSDIPPSEVSAASPIPPDPDGVSIALPASGEAAAWLRIRTFTDRIDAYEDTRNNPAIDLTSRLSADLKYGVIHPRQLMPLIAEHPSKGAAVFRSELCWREFYADVLFHRPETVREAYVPAMNAMETDDGPTAETRFEAWATGRTGFPFIDAGMRQLLHEGWMHNRVRMATASFLVKDLHLPWQRGAAWFMKHLVDGDVASNQHGWQWTAGTGTDASPYFRVFNPTSQGQKFDAQGEYIKRWVPELRELGPKAVHEPHAQPGLGPAGYPPPIVDHAAERLEALDRYKTMRGGVSLPGAVDTIS